jgi:prepilin-type N-terminal cleavage/methylation domain-containing protein
MMHARTKKRGFTLVELMVSLVMGLIVALAAVGLARTATTTFHEQARSSVTEMSVRAAAERLRLDLMRISYMSTGNIQLDPKVAHVQGADTPIGRARYDELKEMRGIRVLVANGASQAPAALNGLKPDAIRITGNLTTDDAYSGQIMTGGTCSNGQKVRLDPIADAAVYELAGRMPTDKTLFEARAKAAFIPGNVWNLAQVIDAIGCTHYVPVCGVAAVASTGGNWALEVSLAGSGSVTQPVLYANTATGTNLAANCGSSEGGKVTIAPISQVRWALTPTVAGLQPDPLIEPAGLKYDLTRQQLDWKGDPAGTPEVVSEYAIDLKFGITVDNPATPSPNSLAIHDLDTDDGTGPIDDITNKATTVAGQAAPQRVRSVRFRVATRTSVADRELNLPMPTPYLARYCVGPGPLTTCKKWSRVRTIVSEVALHNQARMNW